MHAGNGYEIAEATRSPSMNQFGPKPSFCEE